MPAKTYVFVAGLLLCGSCTILSTNAEQMRAVSSIKDELVFDENQKLASHHIVFPANQPHCAPITWEKGKEEVPDSFTAAPLEGGALGRLFPDFEEHDGSDNAPCLAACLERGTDINLAGYTMPHFHYKSMALATSGKLNIEEKAKFQNWFTTTCRKVEVCFINYVSKDRPLLINWIEKRTNKKVKQFDLAFSERKTQCFHSFIGHEFEAVDTETQFYEKFTVEYTTTKAFGTSPPSSTQRFDGNEEVESSVKSALEHEWNKHKHVERTFSSLGFAKGKLPDDVFANMGAFHYNNRHNAVNEEWTGKGFFVNWWETDVKFIPIPWNTKQKWQLRLSELVSIWAGVEVEETSMYGLRQYEQGARLLSHVDRLPTHAVSLIVNIAQDNLANPWPIEVFDHADRLHEVTMEAGDIVYYESAKNLHSRNRPLTCKQGGCHFVNLFTHYRPVGDGASWHNNLSDMPNRPPPLLEGQVDYDSEPTACRLPEEQDSNNTDENDLENSLGVGTVECNDKRLGTYISPTLFRATSGSDLFRWWKATSDPNFIGFGPEDGDDAVNDEL